MVVALVALAGAWMLRPSAQQEPYDLVVGVASLSATTAEALIDDRVTATELALIEALID
jgi:hypothetical protein